MRFKLVLVGILASLVAIAGGTALSVYFTHPRDANAYLVNLHDAGTGPSWQRAFRVQTDGYFLIQAEDACAWLGDQPLALWRADAWYELPALVRRYGDTADVGDKHVWGSVESARAGRALIARYAFEHICGATYTFHRPYQL